MSDRDARTRVHRGDESTQREEEVGLTEPSEHESRSPSESVREMVGESVSRLSSGDAPSNKGTNDLGD